MTTTPDTGLHTESRPGPAPGAAIGCGDCPAPGCRLCRTLSGPGRPLVQAVSRAVRLKAGRSVPLSDLVRGGVAVLCSGRIAVTRLFRDGRRAVVAFGLPGELVPPVGDAVAERLAVEVLSDATVRVADAAVFDQDAEAAADVRAALMALLRDDLARAHERAAHLCRLSAPERVAAFIVDFVRRTHGRCCDGDAVVFPMTRDDIADHLGLKPETVSRQFSRLRQAGVITLPKPDTVRVRLADALMDITPIQAA
jgi:CRP/FNR family transcriptional regulator